MAVSDSEFKSLIKRVENLEQQYNRLVVAIRATTTQEQLSQLLILMQTADDDLVTRVGALETKIGQVIEETLS